MDNHSGYLKSKVNPLLEPLMTELLIHKPSDAVGFIIDWLEKSKGHGKGAKEVKKIQKDDPGSEEENITDQEEDQVPESVIAKKRISSTRKAISAEVDIDLGKQVKFIPRVIPKTEDQNQRIRTKLQACFIFNALDAKEIEVVVGAMEEKQVKAGTRVITQKDEGDNLYVIDSGTLTCVRQMAPDQEPKFLKDYQPGEAFGELALLYNAPRAATITAKTDCVLWSLDRATFTNIVKNAAMKKRSKYEEFLKSVKIFGTVENYELMRVMDAVKPMEYKAGEVIIKEGDEGSIFFLLESGEAIATKNLDPGKPPQEVMNYKKGAYFGELALLKNTPRAATVTAKTDCVCLTLDRHSFKRLLGPLDEILKRNTEVYQRYVSKP